MKALANSIQLLQQLRKQNSAEDDSLNQGSSVSISQVDKNYGSIKRFQKNPSNYQNQYSNKDSQTDQSYEPYFNEKKPSFNKKNDMEKQWRNKNKAKQNFDSNNESLLQEFKKDGDKLFQNIGEIFNKVRNEQY